MINCGNIYPNVALVVLKGSNIFLQFKIIQLHSTLVTITDLVCYTFKFVVTQLGELARQTDNSNGRALALAMAMKTY